MSPRTVSALTLAFALGLLGLGALFVFAPEEAGAALTGRGDPLAFSLLGAALLGLGMVTWMTRRAPIGGIYGRPVLTANLAHFLVGGLALLRVMLDGAGTGWPAALGAFYLAGAAFYGALLFSNPARVSQRG
jgi:hypothetical protein